MSKAILEKKIHKKEIYRIFLKKRRAPPNTYGTLPATHDDKWLFLPSSFFLSDKFKDLVSQAIRFLHPIICLRILAN